MIFLTIGTSKRDFSRLLKEVDRLVELGILRDVFAQVGASHYLPMHYPYKDYLPRDAELDCIQKADLVIAHGGGGTLEECLAHHKKVVVVPRKAALGEGNDDHQMELARFLEDAGRALVAWEVTDLQRIVEQARSWTPSFAVSHRDGDIAVRIVNYIEENLTLDAAERSNWWFYCGLVLFWSL